MTDNHVMILYSVFCILTRDRVVLDNLMGWEDFFLKLYITAPVHSSETVHTRSFTITLFVASATLQGRNHSFQIKLVHPLMSKYLSNSISNSAFLPVEKREMIWSEFDKLLVKRL